MAITKPAIVPMVPMIDPDEERAAIEGATHGDRDERPTNAAGRGRAPRLEQRRQRVMVNLQPDLIPELDRRASEYGYSRSMYIMRILNQHLELMREQDIAEQAAREAREHEREVAEEKRAAKRAAAKALARKRARAQ